MENQENTNIDNRKNCPKCSQKNKEDNEFCFYCGYVFKKEKKKNTTKIENKNVTQENNINYTTSQNELNTVENIITEENITANEVKYCNKCNCQNNITNTFCLKCGNYFKELYCNKCKFPNNITSNFCTNCGNKLNSEEQHQENNLTEQTENKYSKKSIFMMVIGIIALLPFILNPIGIILLIIYLFFPRIRKGYHSILETVGSIASGGIIIFLILFGACIVLVGIGNM